MRGSLQEQVTLTAVEGWNPIAQNEDLLALDMALSKLEKADPRAARVVELRFFGAPGRGGRRSAGRLHHHGEADWKVARAWLSARLQGRT
jgi:hypothetical protein